MNGETWIESVRKRPAMFIGDTTGRGRNHLVFELIANGLDEYLHGHATSIDVQHDLDHFVVTDDGRGLAIEPGPHGEPGSGIHHLIHPHDSRSADDHAPHVHLCSMGVGLAVVCALSSRMCVQSWRDGKRWAVEFSRGVQTGPVHCIATGSGRGSRVEVWPDPQIFDESRFDAQIRSRLFDATHLFPGLRVSLREESFYAPQGLMQLASLIDDHTSRGPHFCKEERFYAHLTSDDITIQATSLLGGAREIWRTWANGVETKGHGSHKDGFRDAHEEAGLLQPTTALIHVVMHKPEFAGPTRDKLAAPEVRDTIQHTLAPLLHAWGSRSNDFVI